MGLEVAFSILQCETLKYKGHFVFIDLPYRVIWTEYSKRNRYDT